MSESYTITNNKLLNGTSLIIDNSVKNKCQIKLIKAIDPAYICFFDSGNGNYVYYKYSCIDDKKSPKIWVGYTRGNVFAATDFEKKVIKKIRENSCPISFVFGAKIANNQVYCELSNEVYPFIVKVEKIDFTYDSIERNRCPICGCAFGSIEVRVNPENTCNNCGFNPKEYIEFYSIYDNMTEYFKGYSLKVPDNNAEIDPRLRRHKIVHVDNVLYDAKKIRTFIKDLGELKNDCRFFSGTELHNNLIKKFFNEKSLEQYLEEQIIKIENFLNDLINPKEDINTGNNSKSIGSNGVDADFDDRFDAVYRVDADFEGRTNVDSNNESKKENPNNSLKNRIDAIITTLESHQKELKEESELIELNKKENEDAQAKNTKNEKLKEFLGKFQEQKLDQNDPNKKIYVVDVANTKVVEVNGVTIKYKNFKSTFYERNLCFEAVLDNENIPSDPDDKNISSIIVYDNYTNCSSELKYIYKVKIGKIEYKNNALEFTEEKGVKIKHSHNMEKYFPHAFNLVFSILFFVALCLCTVFDNLRYVFWDSFDIIGWNISFGVIALLSVVFLAVIIKRQPELKGFTIFGIFLSFLSLFLAILSSIIMLISFAGYKGNYAVSPSIAFAIVSLVISVILLGVYIFIFVKWKFNIWI